MPSDPFRTQTFYLELGPFFKGPILKVSGLSYEREVKTVQQSTKDGKIIINQLPGKYVPATLTITKAVTADKGLWDWRKKVLEMKDISKVRLNGSVTVYDNANGGAILKWNIIGVWPSRIKGPVITIEADTAQEEIELCYEELKQVVG